MDVLTFGAPLTVRLVPPWRGPPTAPSSAPPEEHDEDHEVLCDCGWARVPGQSCAETRGKPDFGCWSDCCAQHERQDQL